MIASGQKLLAPVSGLVIPLANVPDPVFAQKLVGNGVAIEPTSQQLLAPCSGSVIQLHSAHHAITVRTAQGVEVLMHIGIDTVQLKGLGFQALVKIGDSVKAGQPLIHFAADTIAEKAKSLITLMIVTGDAPSEVLANLPLLVEAGKDPMMVVQGSESASPAAKAANATSAKSKPLTLTLPTGLHARPAAQLVALAKSFQAKIEVQKADGKSANGKSVVGLLGLEIDHGDSLTFSAQGADAEKAVHDLYEFLSRLEEQSEAPAPQPMVRPMVRTASRDGNVLTGVAVSPGLAIGRVQQIRAQTFAIVEQSTTSVNDERTALNQALETGLRELQDLFKQLKGKDASRAAIFSAHQELLEDPDILSQASEVIEQGKSAAFAWNQSIETHAERLAGLNNELMANRANDLRDVGRRVLRLLVGEAQSGMPKLGSGVILVAENLTPSETVQLDRDKVFAFCTTTGGATSHVAILARSLGLPAIAGIDRRVLDIADGTEVVLDGDRGEMRLKPSDAEKRQVIEQQQAQSEKRKIALTQAHQPAFTMDGQRIEVAANIGSVADAQKAVEMGADGVGLLRSEFLFLERATAPSEDEQYQIYQQIADILGDRPLIVRTLDVGGDKPLQYLPLPAEENPFLGIRGIRVGLLHQQILRDQLRAILRVKGATKMHIMFPMIATLEELLECKKILEEERRKLGAPVVKIGIMVEVPSAALIADVLAREVDFFSIGTNDLTQYTLAMDRGHKDLAKLADAMHPGVLKLIELTCKAAKAHGKWVGVCGGLAGDLKAVSILIGLGVEELSVSIPTIPMIKAQVRLTRDGDAQQLGLKALQAFNGNEVRALNSEVQA
jgi:phosphoenolpyruvate-protein phosphotransferase